MKEDNRIYTRFELTIPTTNGTRLFIASMFPSFSFENHSTQYVNVESHLHGEGEAY